jgi:hypothetical protein
MHPGQAREWLALRPTNCCHLFPRLASRTWRPDGPGGKVGSRHSLSHRQRCGAENLAQRTVRRPSTNLGDHHRDDDDRANERQPIEPD